MFYYDYTTTQSNYLQTNSTSKVNALLAVSNTWMASGSADGSISIYNSTTTNYTCRTPTSSSGGIIALAQGFDGLLVSASQSTENMIRFWYPNNCSAAGTNISVSLDIVQITISTCVIATVSYTCLIAAFASQTVMIYDYNAPHVSLQSITLGSSNITAMSLVNSCIITGHLNGTLCSYNLTSYASNCFTGHSAKIVSLKMINITIFATFGLDNSIQFWKQNDTNSYVSYNQISTNASLTPNSITYLSTSNVLIATFSNATILKISLANWAWSTYTLSYTYDYVVSVQFSFSSNIRNFHYDN
jgi:hypothetical protein